VAVTAAASPSFFSPLLLPFLLCDLPSEALSCGCVLCAGSLEGLGEGGGDDDCVGLSVEEVDGEAETEAED
jgi:hypothetical protein